MIPPWLFSNSFYMDVCAPCRIHYKPETAEQRSQNLAMVLNFIKDEEKIVIGNIGRYTVTPCVYGLPGKGPPLIVWTLLKFSMIALFFSNINCPLKGRHP